MGKMTTFTGQPQYLQILNLANRSKLPPTKHDYNN